MRRQVKHWQFVLAVILPTLGIWLAQRVWHIEGWPLTGMVIALMVLICGIVLWSRES